MILAWLAAAAIPPVETAERAFASAAQTQGQWTAFRTFAAPDATMIIDGPQPAAPFLAGRADPKGAVMWWPMRTVTSCDGTMALSTGPWRSADGTKTGRYYTIWRHKADGWHWVFDGGTDEAGVAAGDLISGKRGGTCHKPHWGEAEPGALAGGGSVDDSFRWRVDKAAQGYRLRVFTNVGPGAMKDEDVVLR
ncbi:hypothetical protein FHS31_002717 [Sphingomonas vulcanisoli]|uniref:DUF1579 domain-containing protein n=1 Tax=Sphingomonas vulcanisoli TaxID=1658060 RepID=A0ABX0TZA9_9SPHN|nr:hypothetical protein [Sphingomonas vulcanisoli]NIJ09085.1 hypothetical protein [Sphingomonas vulcanisoli]